MPGEEHPGARNTSMLCADVVKGPCPAAYAQLTQGMLFAGVNKDEIFTTNPRETPVHIVVWGFLGEAFPFFKPNFTKMEEYGRDMGADEVQPIHTGPLSLAVCCPCKVCHLVPHSLLGRCHVCC